MKKIISSILVICTLSLLVPQITMASNESELIRNLKNVTSDNIIKTCVDDFDRDGVVDMFALTGHSGCGDVWFVSTTMAKKMENMHCNVFESGEEPEVRILNVDGIKFFEYFYVFGTGTISYLCFFDNSQKLKTAEFDGYFEYGDNGFCVNTSTYDAMILKSDYSGHFRTRKKYWYYFDNKLNEFKEYGGTEISIEEFLQFDGAQDILDLVLDGEIYNILYRDNGIININIIKDGGCVFKENDSYECSYIVVGYDNNSVWTINDQHTDAPDEYSSPIYGGCYLSALKREIATYPIFEKNKPIKVILNGRELTFDQPPIIEDDRVLVPIRKIAEAMGDTVKWNQDTLTAFIRHKDRALIIPLDGTSIIVAPSAQFSDWWKYPTDVPSQSKNDRTLTPVRAFCESLGADVKWDNDSKTVYIEYDASCFEATMTDEIEDKIHLQHSLLVNHESSSFKKYTNNIHEFLDTRSTLTDSIAMAWGSGVFEWAEDVDEGASKAATKAAIAAMAAEMAKNAQNDENYFDKFGYISSAMENANSLINVMSDSTTNIPINKLGIDKQRSLLKSITNLTPETEQLSGKIDYIKWGVFGINEVLNWATDYSRNITYLEIINDIFEKYDIEDEVIFECIDDLKLEYTNKWLITIENVEDLVISQGLDKAVGKLTSGLYDLVTFAKDTTNQLTGLAVTADGLYEFYATCPLNGAVDLAYTRMTNAITNSDFDTKDLTKLFEMQKAVKITAFNSMNKVANAVDEVLWDNQIDEVQNKTCIFWE